MTAQFARAPHRGRVPGGAPIHEPHAALLIDFDNVTMGIRSDLTKELKNLLNSDIIKGKVAVQRAYADWRRYPQYIVPLAESSVDLIFAPAYGSAKKNATDIRLAIDAVELVFTRPEIGTIILLSGDSDFSSLVLKLKEYGKYVIGVGIRESASDLLVQNCDEYYSYSALTGLTRAGEEEPVVSEDPWELVRLALRRMEENNDVMRSDRLKQVLLEMDPNFDEKALGFQKFNRFLQDAQSRRLLSLKKQENGQYEIGPASDEAGESDGDAESREPRRGRSRRGRGGRGRDSSSSAEAAGSAGSDNDTAAEQPDLKAEGRSEPKAEARPEPKAEPKAAEPAAEKAASTQDRPKRAAREERAREAGASDAVTKDAGANDLRTAYKLLQRAAIDLVKKTGEAARDSDVKRRMLEIEPDWDEAPLGFSKFSRFLRKAHEDEIVTLRRDDSGNYDVAPGNADLPAGEDERGGRRDRGRHGTSDSERQAPSRSQPARSDSGAGSQAAAPAAAADGAAPAASPGPSAAIGFRRGSRGRGAPSGPPPLLEGQTAGVSKAAASMADEAVDSAEPKDKASRPAKKTARKSAAKKTAKSAAPAKSPARKAAKKTSGGRFDAAALGLPTDAGEIANYMTSYKGVGPKSVQTLIETFGAGRVFDALETEPDRVREVISGARGETLLDAWADDVAARRAGQTPAAGRGDGQAAQAARKSRGRRGGRRSGRHGSPASK